MRASVIIPFFKGNKYMSNMIDMLNKNYILVKDNNMDMEAIIVNDSPMVKVNINKDNIDIPIAVVNNLHNVGIHKTRVNGLDNSHGDVILFLDQDDIISDNALFSQMTNLGDADFVVCNGYLQDADGRKKEIFQNINHQRCSLNLDFHYGYGNPIASPGQVLIQKKAIPEEWKTHFFQNNGADDHYLWLLLLENKKIGKINTEKLYTHVMTGNNTSLDLDAMCKSNQELVALLDGKVDYKRLYRLKRRALYYGSHPERILTKLRFLDVGIFRRYYSKMKQK
jgi:glycosyltransferase involved in cell wall biosynthesis